MIRRNHYVVSIADTADVVGKCRAAIAAGEEWLRLDLRATTGDVDSILTDVIALCRNNQVILTIVDDIDRVESERVHGIHISNDVGDDALISVRSRLGANAIIGVTVGDGRADDDGDDSDFLNCQLNRFRALDIDYFSFAGSDYLVE